MDKIGGLPAATCFICQQPASAWPSLSPYRVCEEKGKKEISLCFSPLFSASRLRLLCSAFFRQSKQQQQLPAVAGIKKKKKRERKEDFNGFNWNSFGNAVKTSQVNLNDHRNSSCGLTSLVLKVISMWPVTGSELN
ncbi:hypothetical protein AXF42_Ash016856 [Apostasia shenzhenica]|uniref:Uncharacterized protein n=1 Tax=Apostasia shenzhenica TaxID=1088818 RepID=A0A2I0BAK8_9ASPA|nr:hypothetical protein AXF42_Ash016856 [Apostasia shenzhenica]